MNDKIDIVREKNVYFVFCPLINLFWLVINANFSSISAIAWRAIFWGFFFWAIICDGKNIKKYIEILTSKKEEI
jgi:hypothetical protein